MKAKVFSAIIGLAGLAGLAETSFGQGSVFFDNYSATPYFPVVYYPSGLLAGGDVRVELGYALGANQFGIFTLIPSSVTAINPQIPGYFQGPVVTIPDYVSGPVTFEILVSISSFGPYFFSVNYRWTEPSISVLPSPAEFFQSLPGNIAIPIPEPSTLAVAGLGALFSLTTFRRKQP